MFGSDLIVSGNFRGKESIEGVIQGTPLPGCMMELVPGVAADGGGRFTYRAYQPGTSGLSRPVLILLPDDLQGFSFGTAYTSGARGKMCVPYAGDEVNILCATYGTGTGKEFSVGDLLMAHSGTGLFVPASDADSTPFQVLEQIGDNAAGYELVHCVCTGY